MVENIFTDYKSPQVRAMIHSGVVKSYAVAGKDVVDIFARPLRGVANLNDAARNRNRTTQVVKNDPSLDVLSDPIDGWVLVRFFDGTVGWVEGDDLALVDQKKHPHEPLVTSQEFVERFLGTTYLRGGTTEAGIDCSGLTQRYWSSVRGVVIPRHSTDQWGAGGHVEEAQRERGDILNLRNRASSTDHVGIYLDGGQVLHACLDRKGVVVESLDEVKKRYDILGTTRIGHAL